MIDPASPPRSRRRAGRAIGLLVAVSFAMVVVVGCGPSEDHTALAVGHPQWSAEPAGAEALSLRLDTECADLAEATVEPGAGFDGVPLVTVWGRPRVGRCRTELMVVVPVGTTRIEDAATGTVIDLPAP